MVLQFDRSPRRRWPWLCVALTLASCTAATGPCPEPLDPTMSHFGRTYAEWGADWWRWFQESRYSHHPVLDTTGMDCGENQPSGEVFYLAGTPGGPPLHRSCTIPASRSLLIPILNGTADNGGVAMPVSDMALRDFVQSTVDTVASMTLEVDGCSIPELERFRTGLGTYSYDCPMGDCIYAASGSDFYGHVEPAYADGYVVLLPPLSPGHHTVHVTGTLDLGTPDTRDDFHNDVTYDLTVE
jgi:hypothetical protein